MNNMTSNRLELIAEMLEKNPDDTFLNYAAALEYKKENDIKRAISIFQKIVEQDPEYLATYYQLGKLLEETGKVAEAIALYQRGHKLALEKNDVKATGELYEALLILGEDDQNDW